MNISQDSDFAPLFPDSLPIIRRGSIYLNKAHGCLTDDFHKCNWTWNSRYMQPLLQSSIGHSRLLWVQEKHKTYKFMEDSLTQSDHCVFPFFCYFFINLLIYQPIVKTRDVDKCYMQSVMQKLAAFLSRQHAKFGIQQDIMEIDQFSKVHSSYWIIFLHSCQAPRQGPWCWQPCQVANCKFCQCCSCQEYFQQSNLQ